MTAIEIIVIIACVLIVSGVAAAGIIRKKKGKLPCERQGIFEHLQ